MSALVTVDEVRDTLGSAIADRADVGLLIAAASDAVEAYCRRSFARAELVEDLDGRGEYALALPRPPVESLASILLRDEGTTLSNGDGTDWRLDATTGLVWRGEYGSRCWPCGRRNIRVTYTGGYDPIPEAVRYAVLLTIREHAQATAMGDLLKRRRLGDAEIETHAPTADLPTLGRSTRALLARYVLPLTR